MNDRNNDTLMRCAVYSRCQSRSATVSIDDQKRVCSEVAAQRGWQILEEHVYVDEAMSGMRTLGRKGLEALETAAEQRPLPFDYILFDDTSRLGRDQADLLRFHKLVNDHGIKMFFVGQRLDSADPNFSKSLDVLAMIDEQYLRRLKYKVHSGQKGRVLARYVAGGWPYGYRAIVDANLDQPGAVQQERHLFR